MKLPILRKIYDRRKRAKDGKPGKVEIEVYLNNKRKYISTGVSVLPEEWDGNEVCNRADAFALNRSIERQMEPIREAIGRMAASGEAFSLGALGVQMQRKRLTGSFIDYVEDKILHRKDIAESTRRAQMKIVAALREYKGISQFSDVTLRNVKGFDQWLHGKYTNQCTVHGYHKTLKTYVNAAILDGLLGESPYSNLKIKRGQPQRRRYLEMSELRKIESFQTEVGYINRARDLFLFQCYTGLAYSDMETFDFRKVEKRDGKYILYNQRRKTGVEYYVVLLQPVVDILKKYDFKLPIISNAKYNQALKYVAAIAGLNFNLTSHCGRHTFATWALNQGVRLANLKTMLGHSDTKTTEIYAKILKKTVEDDFAMLDRKIKARKK